MRWLKPAALMLVSSSLGCPGGTVAKKLLPKPQVVVPDKDQVGKCKIRKSSSKPLIVEWPSSERAELESIRSRGTVVVRYDGCEMQLLSHCRAPGSYGYIGVSPKQDSIVMRDADELWANIPMGAAKLEGTLARAGKLTVEMTTAGRYMIEDAQVRRDELKGVCQGATHIITGMTVGAFEFYSGSKAQVGAGASVANVGAGAKSNAAQETLKKDGSSKLCFSSARKAEAKKAPPHGCGAVLRIAVLPLGEVPKAAVKCPAGTRYDGKNCIRTKIVVSCPRGSAWNGSACVGKMQPAPVISKKKDSCKSPSACERRCKSGEAKSCAYAAYLYRYGKEGASKDAVKARKLYRLGCDKKLASACNALGNLMSMGQGGSKNLSDAARLFERACTMKDGVGCSNLAYAYRKGRGVAPDATRAVDTYERGCLLRDGYSCHRAGLLHAAGEGNLKRDDRRALKLYDRGCGLGYGASCTMAGEMAAGGRGTRSDPSRARSYYSKGCRRNQASSCNRLGVLYQSGKGGKRDNKRARSMFEKGCRHGIAAACSNLGFMYEHGLGGDRNTTQSAKLYRQGCNKQNSYACYNLAVAYRDGKGVPKDATLYARYVRKSCSHGLARACRAVKTLKTSTNTSSTPANNRYRGMKRIEAGKFWMGCSSRDKHCQADERPGKHVELSAFWLDETEVTTAAYTRCVKSGRCTKPRTGKYCNFSVRGKEKHPINCVDYSQAKTYCRWMKKRLPTEAEWERAARFYNNIYPWGKAFAPGKACYNRLSSKQGTCRVASYPEGKSGFGIHDMGGNVFEWVKDFYDPGYYRRMPRRFPKGPSTGKKRAVRGGGWDSRQPKSLRTGDRRGVNPTMKYNWIGFRCAS